jgi:hypothetical protein
LSFCYRSSSFVKFVNPNQPAVVESRESKSGEGYHTFSPPIPNTAVRWLASILLLSSQEKPAWRSKQKKIVSRGF